jgi:glycine dehydrogenase
MSEQLPLDELRPPRDSFARRHIGPTEGDASAMLETLGVGSLDELIAETIPSSIRLAAPLALPEALSEAEALAALRSLALRNEVFRSFIGMGYSGCHLPAVIRRMILENPGWYTQYTPYQAEIAQGRLEALLNFQTMVADLTGLPLANASLLDEATAAAEAMHMCFAIAGAGRSAFWVAEDVHPQTLAVVRTRARPLGWDVVVGREGNGEDVPAHCFGALVQYPATDGCIRDLEPFCERLATSKIPVVVATDLLALALLRPPGELGAAIAVGSAQRFGVPMGFGGPHAAFLATRDEYRRQIPGRIVGVSKDAEGRPAYRLALQTREQHIRREKATSNICTSQVLLAVMASMYAVWHGPEGLTAIAKRVHGLTALLAEGLRSLGLDPGDQPFFDTLRVPMTEERSARTHDAARQRRLNLRRYPDHSVGMSLDETTTLDDVRDLLAVFALGSPAPSLDTLADRVGWDLPSPHRRRGAILSHPVFSSCRCEHDMVRYLRRLESRDLSLTTSMISLGSCTMKLNATAEMLPITWDELADLHPFAPPEQAQGYAELFRQLEAWLAEITGFAAVSLQPNAGSQGEYAGLLTIRAYHESRGQSQRDVCLIPVSAHGTNPASSVMAGFTVVPVACDAAGSIDLDDLRARAAANAERLGALMVTYPSTHGVFESAIREVCDVVHAHGGQVYMDGANMNAQVGLTRPAGIGADVCHLNLHKTFAIPHGGGGPGMGPIAVAEHLAPFLPGHPVTGQGGSQSLGTIAAAPQGSAGILPISWMYVAMMGGDGLRRATEIAILNANYMAHRLAPFYPVLYSGERGRVAHEFIIDARGFKASGIEVEDIAKRLMDYGFHAPTISFPVPGTLMIEPTESEPRAELDRLCDALISIREEIRAVEEGRADPQTNVLKRAPHTQRAVCSDAWDRAYSREVAAFPAPWTREHKFWPVVARIDNAWGDRNLACLCPPVDAYGRSTEGT